MSHRAATSISGLDLCLETLRGQAADEKKKAEGVRFPFPFEYEDYKALLTQSANILLERRRERNTFCIDERNEPVIRQLYLYLKLDSQFQGDMRKGIMLVGRYGSGKTLIMQALTEMYNTVIRTYHLQRPLLAFIKSSDLLNELKSKPVNAYSRLPLIIDEFGREPKQIMDFGNLRSPMIELLCERYDNGTWTHGTSNFTLETLSGENQYGKMTGDRIKSMFNFIELEGESRRR
jgi:DNA replication protein DnaC